ncbi:MAG: hypothetical protein IT423_05805 [Pirellulaceae bacterium]|nr:hypothetical protein [Pirellulaceae bacterium]
MSRASTQQMLRKLPVKWAVALLVMLVTYAIVQPIVNSRLGWSLPSIAQLLGEPEAKPKGKTAAQKQNSDTGSAPPTVAIDSSNPDSSNPESSGTESSDTESARTQSSGTNSKAVTEKPSANSSAKSPVKPAAKPAEKSSESKSVDGQPSGTSNSKTASSSAPSVAKSAGESQGAADRDLLYGILKETGRERYVSKAGLQYSPGSEEGHRLKHLERHLRDMPDRPGKHGVFDGDMSQALKWIDDAYARGQRGAKGVRKQVEDGRTVYEAPFDKPIGFIGGREGGRAGHPPAKRLRLVVEDSRFITAFPF